MPGDLNNLKKLFVPVTYATQGLTFKGNWACALIDAATETAGLVFEVPEGMNVVTEASLVCLPVVNSANMKLDMHYCGTLTGFAFNFGCNNTTLDFATVADQFLEIDLLAALAPAPNLWTAATAGYRIALRLLHNAVATASNIHVVGLKYVWR